MKLGIYDVILDFSCKSLGRYPSSVLGVSNDLSNGYDEFVFFEIKCLKEILLGICGRRSSLEGQL